MKILHMPTIAAAIVVSLAHCQSTLDKYDPTDPRTYTPSADYPCGTLYSPCTDAFDGGAEHRTGRCCPNETMCGGVSPLHRGCPPGACCPVGGTSDEGYGAARMTQQRPETDFRH